MERKIMSVKNNYNTDVVIKDILQKYGDDVFDVMCESIVEVGKECTKRIRANIKASFKSRNGKKQYLKGWRVKLHRTRLGMEAVVYASDTAGKPSLTHLLEKGHVKANGRGRVEGTPHIGPVNEWAQEEVMERIEEKILAMF